MPGQRRDIERELEKLPDFFTTEEIQTMYKNLNEDVKKLKSSNVPFAEMEAQLHKTHKTLAYSYPTLFFKTVREEMDPHIFASMMKIKHQMDQGQISHKKAKELVIDGAKRHVEGEAPRMSKPQQEGSGQVQEIILQCKVDGS